MGSSEGLFRQVLFHSGALCTGPTDAAADSVEQLARRLRVHVRPLRVVGASELVAAISPKWRFGPVATASSKSRSAHTPATKAAAPPRKASFA